MAAVSESGSYEKFLFYSNSIILIEYNRIDKNVCKLVLQITLNNVCILTKLFLETESSESAQKLHSQ